MMKPLLTNNIQFMVTPEKKQQTSPKKQKEDPVVQKLRQTIILMIQQKQRVSVNCRSVVLNF